MDCEIEIKRTSGVKKGDEQGDPEFNSKYQSFDGSLLHIIAWLLLRYFRAVYDS